MSANCCARCVKWLCNGSITLYVKLWFAHAPGLSGTCFPLPISKKTASKISLHAPRHVRDVRAVMHVGIANPRWRGKRSRHSRRMHKSQFYVSGKRPMLWTTQAPVSYHKLHFTIPYDTLARIYLVIYITITTIDWEAMLNIPWVKINIFW